MTSVRSMLRKPALVAPGIGARMRARRLPHRRSRPSCVFDSERFHSHLNSTILSIRHRRASAGASTSSPRAHSDATRRDHKVPPPSARRDHGESRGRSGRHGRFRADELQQRLVHFVGVRPRDRVWPALDDDQLHVVDQARQALARSSRTAGSGRRRPARPAAARRASRRPGGSRSPTSGCTPRWRSPRSWPRCSSWPGTPGR